MSFPRKPPQRIGKEFAAVAVTANREFNEFEEILLANPPVIAAIAAATYPLWRQQPSWRNSAAIQIYATCH